MFGFRFIKVEPTDFVLQYRNGRVVREGTGLSFFYFSPSTSLVRIPLGSMDVPFIFEEVTADFQTVSVQGQISFRVAVPKKLAALMNFTLLPNGHYASEDPLKLPQRLIDRTHVATRTAMKTLALRDLLAETTPWIGGLLQELQQSPALTALGLEVLGLVILAIRPTPETARALEAEAREQILLRADEAIFTRRNAAVEGERAIKENELNTEIAVENKKRQIAEAQMEAEKAVQQKKREIREAEMETLVACEQRRKDLVALASANAREEADARAYAVSSILRALAGTDATTLQVLSNASMQPGQLVALAFKELAESAQKIGQLNVSPDLLRELLDSDRTR